MSFPLPGKISEHFPEYLRQEISRQIICAELFGAQKIRMVIRECHAHEPINFSWLQDLANELRLQNYKVETVIEPITNPNNRFICKQLVLQISW